MSAPFSTTSPVLTVLVQLSAYYNEVKMRPSYRKVFAAASSPMTLAGYIVPAVLKAKFAALTGWYA